MSDVNRADVTVNLRDVYGQTISDDVELTFRNLDVQTLSQKVNVKFKGEPITLTGIPAFPTGRAQVFISPKTYRYKSIFVNVFTGQTNSISEDFFVDPDRARPKLLDFSDIPAKAYGKQLQRILSKSGIDEATWNGLDKRNRATILNLSAKMTKETTRDGRQIIRLVQSILPELLTKKNRARIYSRVDKGLYDEMASYPEVFKPVSGVLHDFPEGWYPISQNNSFKTRDEAGNIQMTFATNSDKLVLADIDLDDHQGIQHAADVLKHIISGKDTDPYDIHEILIYFQNTLDPGYLLI